jgi:all-trans-retinol 13,14-reductase
MKMMMEKKSKVQEETARQSVDGEVEVWDTVVIGSGIGGLSVASLLSQCQAIHNRVLVLEQNKYNAGGCCQAFECKGYPFGVGIHYVADMGCANENEDEQEPLPKQMLDALAPEGDPVQWTRLPNHFESVFIGRKDLRCYDMVATTLKDSLIEQFVEEKKGIQEYFKLVTKAVPGLHRALVFKTLPRSLTSFLIQSRIHQLLDRGFYKYASQTTVKEVVEKVTDNPDLRYILEYMSAFTGTPPSEAPFAMHAQIFDSHQRGVYFPVGGPGQIPEKVNRAIKASGGEIRVNSRVTRILVDKGVVAGVELTNGKKIWTKRVISDAGYVLTFQCLLPEEYQHLHAEPNSLKSPSLRTGMTGLLLHVGLKGDHDEDFGLPRHNLCVTPDGDIEKGLSRMPKSLPSILAKDPEDLDLFITSPCVKDRKWREEFPGKTTLEIFTQISWEAFEDMIDDEGNIKAEECEKYNRFKNMFGQVVWTRTRQALVAAGASATKLPEKLQDADFFQVRTPIAFAHFLGSDRGSFFGLVHDQSRFHPKHFYLTLRPDCAEIPGLYLTGQDIATAGMVGAMMGGYLCAAKVLGENNPLNLLTMVSINRA